MFLSAGGLPAKCEHGVAVNTLVAMSVRIDTLHPSAMSGG